MEKKDAKSIKGHSYDPITGLPTGHRNKIVNAATRPINSSARAIHGGVKKSQTLVRRATKKPVPVKPLNPKTPGRSMDIAKSPMISRFGQKPASNPTLNDKTHKKPNLVKPVSAPKSPVKPTVTAHTQPSSKELKEQVIKEAIDKIPPKNQKDKKIKKPIKKAAYVVLSLALFGLVGYVSYNFVPALSIRVSSSQAGINATYPSYTPDGYSFRGPILFNEGKVLIKYAENKGASSYQITETKSSWDSSAVKENIALSWANHSPSNFEEQGQTVYYSLSSEDVKAAWVNGGILYQLSGDAKLDYDKIRRIVKSM